MGLSEYVEYLIKKQKTSQKAQVSNFKSMVISVGPFTCVTPVC